ncbi:guanylate kinase [Lentimicrobium sp. L6]|uniref:guanylate kinase n=1 Tax=Lentimicrobium sp. L6 TaxID=2735916 RepID=UPI00155198C1|nr:guanylate kinase [Lentimicrobium sp. L6]NPD84870.1 guanylate kinase [Lentimicrobium sp. L6]
MGTSALKRKYIIFSAPSGSGKTTIVREMMKRGFPLEFSVSATSRTPRGNEKDGVDYHFLSLEEFNKKIKNNEFIEWEEVYAGVKYGTPKSELDRIFSEGKLPIFDLDVVGGINLKKLLGKNALAVFIQVSNIDVLKDRLINRATDSEESIQKRLDKAEYEMSFASQFDVIIINNKLEDAYEETFQTLTNFING